MEEAYERIERLEQTRDAQPHEEDEGPNERRRPRDERRSDRRRREQEDDRMEGYKVNIPNFKGKNDPEAYLEWELKIEQLFSCQKNSEANMVKVASLEFTDYALIWWDQLVKKRKRTEEPPVETWVEMRRIMRRRFIPNHYHRELHNKLQRMDQGSQSVDDYFKEMEIALIQANIQEEREATMTKFLQGLKMEIRDVVELHNYVEMEDLVHQAIKVEQQLKRKSFQRKGTTSFNPSNWRDKSKKEGPTRSKLKTSTSHGKTPFKAHESPCNTRIRDIKCFKFMGRGHIASQCPTKKMMMLKDNRDITSDASDESEREEEEEDREILATEGDLLMVRRLLGSKVKESDKSQRENIFHTRCQIQGKICSLFIDGGSCTNIVGAWLVDKLNLETKPHLAPYKLQWLSEEKELTLDK